VNQATGSAVDSGAIHNIAANINREISTEQVDVEGRALFPSTVGGGASDSDRTREYSVGDGLIQRSGAESQLSRLAEFIGSYLSGNEMAMTYATEVLQDDYDYGGSNPYRPYRYVELTMNGVRGQYLANGETFAATTDGFLVASDAVCVGVDIGGSIVPPWPVATPAPLSLTIGGELLYLPYGTDSGSDPLSGGLAIGGSLLDLGLSGSFTISGQFRSSDLSNIDAIVVDSDGNVVINSDGYGVATESGAFNLIVTSGGVVTTSGGLVTVLEGITDFERVVVDGSGQVVTASGYVQESV
jgi:hypothetical protein